MILKKGFKRNFIQRIWNLYYCVRDLWDRYHAVPKEGHDPKESHDQRMRIANTLVREMAVHGDAEEISYYNYLEAQGKKDVVEHSKKEHHEIKNLVYEADTNSSAKDDYDEILSRAVNAFDKHAAEEEKGILVEMEKTLSAKTSDSEARKFLAARETAPPRPHPTAPQTGGTLQEAAAAQAKVPDRLVNFMRRVDYVDLKVNALILEFSLILLTFEIYEFHHPDI
ncbi:hypothetical protein JB92DRAFT_2833702 [Gautieria morchelliformis]|nr:hypothetical protein JB92DRAFT_2833702 [Gautieria morchelliformis]